jgi:hypothetical protein
MFRSQILQIFQKFVQILQIFQEVNKTLQSRTASIGEAELRLDTQLVHVLNFFRKFARLQNFNFNNV